MRVTEQTATRLKMLKAIRTHAPISRAELPALTGLSLATITQVARDLVSRGFLEEARATPKRRAGRPRTYLQIAPRGALVIGANLTQDGTLRVAFVDLAGTKLFGIDVPLKYPDRLEDFATDIAAALEAAIDAAPFERQSISRVGLAIPALVDSRRGIVHRVAIFPTGAVPFADIIGARLRMPVTVEHEMVCMARAEHWFGRAQNLDTFSLLYVGSYIGSAEFDMGLPRLGANGLNSEVGHTKTSFGQGAPRCFCGQYGCVSAFSSVFGMVGQWRGMSEITAESILQLPAMFRTLVDCAAAGDPSAVAVIESAALHLGISVANHINATDPGTIFILAENQRLHSVLAEKAEATARQNILDGILPRTNLVFGLVSGEWRWRGAAALALENLFLEYENAAGEVPSIQPDISDA